MRYDRAAIFDALVGAKAAADVLKQMPHLPSWVEGIHEEQLRLEAVGTSRIEGADFTPREEDEALAPDAPVHADFTRSQRQLRAASLTYRWLLERPADAPATSQFILTIHRRVVTGCDDDHCEPGALRANGHNVTFGSPKCRGAEAGDDCRAAFDGLCNAISGEFKAHDPIIQAIAAHYHIGAMHPFGDGNGRTARALEAFMMRRAGVSDMVMVSLSNYYYEHAVEYRAALHETRQRGHDLTPFLQFALTAVADRCSALVDEVADNQKRLLFRQFAESLFGKLRSSRRRVLAQRQLRMLEILLDGGAMEWPDLWDKALPHYTGLKHPGRAIVRDALGLRRLNAIDIEFRSSPDDSPLISVNLDWPLQMSETEMLEQYERLPSVASSQSGMADLSRLLRRGAHRRA